MTAARDDDEPAPSADMIARLHATLDDVPALAGPREVEALTGGLTNVNFKVTTPERTVVVRLSGSDGDLLSIDRDAEHVNSRRAAESGAAPEVLQYLPEHHALIVAWIEGRTLAADDLRETSMLERVAAVCRTLHAGPRFVGDFDMFAVQRRYLGIVQERGFRLPDRYLELMPQADRIAAALAVRKGPTVPCNNDLLAANFIDDGDAALGDRLRVRRQRGPAPSSSATSGRSRTCRWTSSRRWWTPTPAGTCATRWPGRTSTA